MDVIIAWLRATSLSRAIVLNTWVWPAAETLHFIGLTLVIGIVGLLDLRLIGCFVRIPVAAARQLVPVALIGFALNVVTGAVFLIGHPEQYLSSTVWWMKVGSLGVAGLNAAIFEWRLAGRVLALGPGEAMPMSAKCIGIVSLFAWFSVLYFGRMLPFLGDAF